MQFNIALSRFKVGWAPACLKATVFSRDVMAAILVSLNKGTAAMLVSPTNPLGTLFLCKLFLNMLIDHRVSENTLFAGHFVLTDPY